MEFGKSAANKKARDPSRAHLPNRPYVFSGVLPVNKSGRGDRNRTRSPRFWRPMLYQLSYSPATVIMLAQRAGSGQEVGKEFPRACLSS